MRKRERKINSGRARARKRKRGREIKSIRERERERAIPKRDEATLTLSSAHGCQSLGIQGHNSTTFITVLCHWAEHSLEWRARGVRGQRGEGSRGKACGRVSSADTLWWADASMALSPTDRHTSSPCCFSKDWSSKVSCMPWQDW